MSGIAALTVLFSGCAGEYLAGPYEGPYYGDFGPYYPGYGPSYGGDFVIGGAHYPNHFGGHHFYGQSFGPGILPWRTGRKAFQPVAAAQLRAVMLLAVGATASLKKVETWVEESRRGCV